VSVIDFAVAAFDPVAAAGGDFCGVFAFNFFDGAVCDAGAGFLTGFLADVFGALRLARGADFLADVFDAFPDGVLGDFLRVFLDIRLPFVAFSGSIIAVAGSALELPVLGKSADLRVWLQRIATTRLHSCGNTLGAG
jgi:hypothetical protein